MWQATNKTENLLSNFKDLFPFCEHEDYGSKLTSAMEQILDDMSSQDNIRLIKKVKRGHLYKTHAESINNPEQAVFFFKKYYGINTNPDTMSNIAKENHISVSWTADRIHFVESYLKNHKKDIWYQLI